VTFTSEPKTASSTEVEFTGAKVTVETPAETITVNVIDGSAPDRAAAAPSSAVPTVAIVALIAASSFQTVTV
jgi:hypothetical protein